MNSIKIKNLVLRRSFYMAKSNCCEKCNTQLKENCLCESCSLVSVQCTGDIKNAVCVPILAD